MQPSRDRGVLGRPERWEPKHSGGKAVTAGASPPPENVVDKDLDGWFFLAHLRIT